MMQWKKLASDSPPPNRLLLIHVPDFNSAKFAIREGSEIEVGDSFYKGKLEGVLLKCSVKDLQTVYQNAYWCIYKRPCNE